MLTCLLYHWIALKFVKIVMFTYKQIFLSIIQCTICNVYSISIITTFTASITFIVYKIALIAMKLIEFSLIYLNLLVYIVISLTVTSMINIHCVTQTLWSKKLFVIVFFVCIAI